MSKHLRGVHEIVAIATSLTSCFPLPAVARLQWAANDLVKLQPGPAFQDLCLTQALTWLTSPYVLWPPTLLCSLSSQLLPLFQPALLFLCTNTLDLLPSPASASLVLSV